MTVVEELMAMALHAHRMRMGWDGITKPVNVRTTSMSRPCDDEQHTTSRLSVGEKQKGQRDQEHVTKKSRTNVKDRMCNRTTVTCGTGSVKRRSLITNYYSTTEQLKRWLIYVLALVLATLRH